MSASPWRRWRQRSWQARSAGARPSWCRGWSASVLGLAWLRLPAPEGSAHRTARPFPEIPPQLVRRAVVVLLLIAIVSGLVFNAFTLLLPKLIEERLGGDPRLLPLVGSAAFAATLCGALTQFTVGRMIDRTTLKRVFLPISVLLVPGLVAVSYAQGWLVVPMAALVSAAIFGQVTVNETMTARYISPALRTRMYSVRFFVGFLGAAAAAPVVAWLHERTGSLATATLVMAGFGVITLGLRIGVSRPQGRIAAGALE